MRNLCLVLTTYMLCKQAEWSAARAAEEKMKNTDSEVVQVVVHGGAFFYMRVNHAKRGQGLVQVCYISSLSGVSEQ